MHNVFVYGTLKSGYGNHALLQRSVKGYSAVAPGINLYKGDYFPFAMRGQGQAIGEVYEIDNALLKKLDDLEGHPMFYHRELTPVILDNGQTIKAWIYLYDKAHHYPIIADGNWQPKQDAERP